MNSSPSGPAGGGKAPLTSLPAAMLAHKEASGRPDSLYAAEESRQQEGPNSPDFNGKYTFKRLFTHQIEACTC